MDCPKSNTGFCTVQVKLHYIGKGMTESIMSIINAHPHPHPRQFKPGNIQRRGFDRPVHTYTGVVVNLVG